MRVERAFAFVDLTGFTAFVDRHGDDEAVAVLASFRRVVRAVASDFGAPVMKWLGDGAVFVSADPEALVAAMLDLVERAHAEHVALPIHIGMASGPVILFEGDDYTGRAINLASRLCDRAGAGEVLCTDELADLAPQGTPRVRIGEIPLPGFTEPVPVIRLDARPRAVRG